MKVWKILHIALFILILSSLSVSAAQISQYEAAKIGTSYAYEGELCEAYGPYEYNNNMYWNSNSNAKEKMRIFLKTTLS